MTRTKDVFLEYVEIVKKIVEEAGDTTRITQFVNDSVLSAIDTTNINWKQELEDEIRSPASPLYYQYADSTNSGTNALFIAIANLDSESLKLFLPKVKGFLNNSENFIFNSAEQKISPIHLAINPAKHLKDFAVQEETFSLYETSKIIDLLIEHGADINWMGDFGGDNHILHAKAYQDLPLGTGSLNSLRGLLIFKGAYHKDIFYEDGILERDGLIPQLASLYNGMLDEQKAQNPVHPEIHKLIEKLSIKEVESLVDSGAEDPLTEAPLLEKSPSEEFQVVTEEEIANSNIQDQTVESEIKNEDVQDLAPVEATDPEFDVITTEEENFDVTTLEDPVTEKSAVENTVNQDVGGQFVALKAPSIIKDGYMPPPADIETKAGLNGNYVVISKGPKKEASTELQPLPSGLDSNPPTPVSANNTQVLDQNNAGHNQFLALLLSVAGIFCFGALKYCADVVLSGNEGDFECISDH